MDEVKRCPFCGGKANGPEFGFNRWIAPFPFWDAWEERITHWKPIYPPKEENDETIDG